MSKSKKKYPHLTPLYPLIHADMIFNFAVFIFRAYFHNQMVGFWVLIALLLAYVATAFFPNSPQNRLIYSLQVKLDTYWYERRYGKLGGTVKEAPTPIWIPKDETVKQIEKTE
jgi:hypothetical protein